ncbi:MAG: S8 family serine peptidase [Kiritimatiellia bacterium]
MSAAPSSVALAGVNRELSFEPALLKRLRREWNGQNPPPNPAIPQDRQLLLVNRVISTVAPAPVAKADIWLNRTRRGTLPFLIQFSGPVQDDWQAAVRQTGAVMLQYMPHNGWLVEANPATLKAVQSLPMVHWAGVFEAGDKIQPFLKRLAAAFPDDRRRIGTSILCLSPDDLAPVTEWLRGRGMTVRASEVASAGGVIKARVTLAAIDELAARGDVQWIEEEVPRELDNEKAVLPTHMNAAPLWSGYNLTGKGQIVGHADTGLDTGSTNGIHPDFAGRVLAAFALGRANDWSDVDAHGTHTAGSILGNGAMSGGFYRGPAWESLLVHQSVESSDGSLNGLPNNLSDLFLPTYNLGARVHSDSWGSSVYGQYTIDSYEADLFMWNNPQMLLVFSAGNSGVDTSPANGVVDLDSMGAPGTAKNLLTVGAMESDRPPNTGVGYTWRKWGYSAWPADFPATPIYSDLISYSATLSPYRQGMAGFSSRGPTDDNRIKPDVVAPGTDVISCRSRASSGTGWGVAANTNYLYNGGTSMSCPLTAGAVLLIRQYLVERAGVTNPSAALLKAMIISGARSMTPGQYGTNEYLEIPAASPNNVEGFGQVDVGQSVYPTGMAVRVIDNHRLTFHKSSNTVFTVQSAGSPLSVALVWTDFPGSTLAGIQLVNDYDLTLTTPDDTILYPNNGVGDHVNPVEVIRLTNAASGTYTIRVYGNNVPESSGQYALVIRAAMDERPELIHTPPPAVLMTNSACPISALVTYYAPLTNGQVRLFWTTNGPSGPFEQLPLDWQGGHAYTGAIPSQPIGTVVDYYLSATVSTHSVSFPSNAPAVLQRVTFSNPTISLRVEGTRTNSVVVTPPYGTYFYPSGTWFSATAQSTCYSGTTWRFVCDGWVGVGMDPSNGATAFADATLLQNGSLSWQWGEEALLTQNSSPAGAVDQTSWHRNDTTAETVTAWSFAWDMSSNPPFFYALAGWKIDNVLWTNAASQAPNPATNIPMSQPRTATAWYLPYWTDSDANSLLDWWEYRYSGNTGIVVAAADADGDGWVNEDENLDNTDPWNSNSFPTPPVITHTPPALLQTAAPPWTISAVITDNFMVADAAVFWTVNGGPIRTNTMSALGGDVYRTELDPGEPPTAITVLYSIAAVDGVAQTDSPVYQLVSDYAVLRVGPTNFGTIRLPREGFSRPATVANDGNRPLSWKALALAPAMAEAVETGVNGWQEIGGAWHVSGYRYNSPSNAWYCGSEISRLYSDYLTASLISPPVELGAGGLLTFRHWMRAEEDVGDYYWDGGVVLITTNGGLSYEGLTPLGGYPHRIVPNNDSPFEPDTPCFGSNDWIESVFDLSAYSGAVARVAFVFGADALVRREGWYIDDIWIGSSATDQWLSATGALAGVYAAGFEADPFALTVDSLPLPPQGDIRGAVRLDHSGIGGLTLAPFRLRRPAYITAYAGPSGAVSPAAADLLDNETTNVLFQAEAGSEIWNVTVDGKGLPGAGGQTQFTWHVAAVSADLIARAAFGPHSLTGAPVAVDAVWLGQYYPDALDFEALLAVDSDGDGMAAWEEFVAGSDPTNAESVLRLTDVPVFSGLPGEPVATVQFQSVSGKTYQAQSALTAGGPWSDAGSPVTARGPSCQSPVALSPGTSNAFFRVLVFP